MDHLNEIIAKNLKKHRSEKKLSLDKVALLTGVSKSMLGQIERGETNPTVTTVWKIANGLKVSFTDLISVPKENTIIIRKDDVEPIYTDNNKYKAMPYFTYDSDHAFEIYSVEIEEGGELISESHVPGIEEYVLVYEGQLTIEVDGGTYVLNKGDALAFKGDRNHAYINSGKGKMVANMTLYYTE